MKIYLACPYSHENEKVREKRVEMATKAAAKLMEDGHQVFSPITHTHPISKYTNKHPCDNDFWMVQDLWILVACNEIYVLCLDGWEFSKGVEEEVKVAYRLNKKITYLKGGKWTKE